MSAPSRVRTLKHGVFTDQISNRDGTVLEARIEGLFSHKTKDWNIAELHRRQFDEALCNVLMHRKVPWNGIETVGAKLCRSSTGPKAVRTA